MKRYVYLAGPIFGLSYHEAMDWREEASAAFLPGILGVSPMRMKEFLEGENRIGHHYAEERICGAPMPVACRDFNDVLCADAVLAYVPKWSAERRSPCGTILEIGFAIANQKPIVLVSDYERVRKSPLIMGKVGWQLDTLDEGIAAVNAILGGWR